MTLCPGDWIKKKKEKSLAAKHSVRIWDSLSFPRVLVAEIPFSWMLLCPDGFFLRNFPAKFTHLLNTGLLS